MSFCCCIHKAYRDVALQVYPACIRKPNGLCTSRFLSNQNPQRLLRQKEKSTALIWDKNTHWVGTGLLFFSSAFFRYPPFAFEYIFWRELKKRRTLRVLRSIWHIVQTFANPNFEKRRWGNPFKKLYSLWAYQKEKVLNQVWLHAFSWFFLLKVIAIKFWSESSRRTKRKLGQNFAGGL